MAAKRPKSWCRHCGALATLTKEHLPPRATGNDTAISRSGPVEAERHELLDIASWNDGHALPTLCEACNGKAERWGYPKEYTRWHTGVVGHLNDLAAFQSEDDLFSEGRLYEIELPYDAMPRRFIGHAVSMILAAQWSFHLWAENPQLVELIGGNLEPNDEPPGPVDIAPWRVHLALANQEYLVQRRVAISIKMGDLRPRSSGGIHLPARAAKNVPFYLFAYSPFVVTLMGDNTTPSWPSVDVTDWTLMGHHERPQRNDLRFVIPTIHKPFRDLLGLADAQQAGLQPTLGQGKP